MKVKLEPQLVKNGKLILKEKILTISGSETYIALATQSSNQYSFVVEIEDLEIDESNPEIPTLIANKNKIGLLTEGTVLDIYPYHIPDAKEITIGLSQEYQTITPGDWTASIKDLIINHIYDIGDGVKIPLNVEEKILILRGNLIKCKPEAPVRISSTTTVLIEKFSQDQLTPLLNNLEKTKMGNVRYYFYGAKDG